MPIRLGHDQVQEQLRVALGELILIDAYLLLNDLSERSIAFRLGLHLQELPGEAGAAPATRQDRPERAVSLREREEVQEVPRAVSG